jgi:hypothetical protein
MNVFIVLSCYNKDRTISKHYNNLTNTGLGNMLFQIASGLYYAHKNNALLYVPSLKTYLRLENLKKENTIFRNINIDLLPKYNENNIKQHPHHLGSIFDFDFENNIVVRGYFENINNFHPYKKQILENFRPTQKDSEYLYNKYSILKNNKLTSIHIRRGPDYKKIFSIDQLNYKDNEMLRLLDHMINVKSIRNVFILTNDHSHCKKLFQKKKYKTLNFFYSNERDYYDIWIISLIKNNIVSSSTLAWWGSYLNENTDKYIIMSNKLSTINNPEWEIV